MTSTFVLFKSAVSSTLMAATRTGSVLRNVIAIEACVVVPLLIQVILHPDSHNSPKSGFWGEKTANTNWCEADYAVTVYVAEFFNALSSMFIVIHSGYELVMHYEWAELRFSICFFFLVVTGLGSVAYHTTLWRSMQALDELPMLWCNSAFIYVNLTLEDKRRHWAHWPIALGLLATTVAMSLAIYIFDDKDQVCFLLCYGGGVVWLCYKALGFNASYNPGSSRNTLPELSVVFYLSGLGIWLVDRRFCEHVRSLHLHAIWHVCASLGTNTAILGWMWLRHTALGDNPSIVGSPPLQVIVVEPAKLERTKGS